jgi:hypothetical protein
MWAPLAACSRRLSGGRWEGGPALCPMGMIAPLSGWPRHALLEGLVGTGQPPSRAGQG